MKKAIPTWFIVGAITLLLLSILLSSKEDTFSLEQQAVNSFEQIPYLFLPLPAIPNETIAVGKTLVETTKITEGIQQTIYLSETSEYSDYPYGTYLTIASYNYYLGSSLDQGLLLTKAPLAPVVENTPVFMWSETRGAAYGYTGLLTLQAGKPVRLADIDGRVVFEDLDGDGQNEIVAINPGVLSQTWIYFMGQFPDGMQKINVNDLLRASSVYYENGKFVANTNEDALKKYIYQNGQFVKANN